MKVLSHRPLSKLKSLAVQLLSAITICSPSGEKQQDRTAPPCLMKELIILYCYAVMPILLLLLRILLLYYYLHSYCSSFFSWPPELPHEVPRLHVEEARHTIRGSREKCLATRAEERLGNATHPTLAVSTPNSQNGRSHAPLLCRKSRRDGSDPDSSQNYAWLGGSHKTRPA